MAEAGESGTTPGPVLWRGGRIVLTAVIIGTNLVGIAAVLSAAYLVVPLPRVPHQGHIQVVDAIATAVYVAIAVPAGAVIGTRKLIAVRQWLVEERPAGEEEKRILLLAPLTLFGVQIALWFGAAVLMAVLDWGYSATLAQRVGLVVAISGTVTAACAYLLTERLVRPAAARALAAGSPEGVTVPGVATRAVLAWALGTGLPVLGLVAIGVLSLTGVPASSRQLAVAMIVIGSIGIVVGLLVVMLAARATAAPIDSVRRALERVQRGEFDVHVPVYDSTQIGKLQLGFNEMVDGLAERERIRAAFGTYVDPEVAAHILQEGTALAGEEVEVTIMFIDIRGFTAFAERTPAPDVVAAVNCLFEAVVPIVHAHGGRVDKFIGDGLLAVFGAPRRQADHADRALSAAVAIDEAVRAGQAGALAVGIGLNSGVVVTGNVGGGGRLEFSVIGDPVNVAARVEAATRQTGDSVLLAQRTKDLLRRAPPDLIEREGVALKGKTEIVRIYAVAPAPRR